MQSWKNFLAVSVACSSLFVTAPAYAAYQLNDEVSNPPAALQMATQIGVLKYDNPAMQSAPNKDAIVVLSFGTTYKDQRAKAIDATANAIAAAHPNAKVVTAFTSHIVIKHIIENEGKCDYMTPEQTLDQLKREGYTRVALVSLDVIPGMEYKYDVALFHEYKTHFKKITLGEPLMYWQISATTLCKSCSHCTCPRTEKARLSCSWRTARPTRPTLIIPSCKTSSAQ